MTKLHQSAQPTEGTNESQPEEVHSQPEVEEID